MQVQRIIREGLTRIEHAVEPFEFLAAQVPEGHDKFKRIVRHLLAAASYARAVEHGLPKPKRARARSTAT